MIFKQNILLIFQTFLKIVIKRFWRVFLFKFKILNINLSPIQQIPIEICYPRENYISPNHIFQNGNDEPREHQSRGSIVNLLKIRKPCQNFQLGDAKHPPRIIIHAITPSNYDILDLKDDNLFLQISVGDSLLSQTDQPPISPREQPKTWAVLYFFPAPCYKSHFYSSPDVSSRADSRYIYISPPSFNILRRRRPDVCLDLATGSRMQLLNRPRQNWWRGVCAPRAIPRVRSRDRYYSRRVQSLGDRAPFLFQIWFPRWICFFY